MLETSDKLPYGCLCCKSCFFWFALTGFTFFSTVFMLALLFAKANQRNTWQTIRRIHLTRELQGKIALIISSSCWVAFFFFPPHLTLISNEIPSILFQEVHFNSHELHPLNIYFYWISLTWRGMKSGLLLSSNCKAGGERVVFSMSRWQVFCLCFLGVFISFSFGGGGLIIFLQR